MLLFLLCVHMRIVTKYRGPNSTFCHRLLPCGYETALRIANSSSIIILADKMITSPSHISAMRELIRQALEIGAQIDGNSTIIDGTLSPNFSNGFIEAGNLSSIAVSNMTFANFQYPVLAVDGCKRLIFFNIVIQSAKMDSMSPIFSINNSRALFDSVKFVTCSVRGASILQVANSSIAILETTLYNNFAYHISQVPFISFMHSSASIINSGLLFNSAPHSPFIALYKHSRLSILGSIIQTNTNPELIASISSSTFVNISDTRMIDNMATIYSSSLPGILLIRRSNFSDNFSADRPIFSLRNSTIATEENVDFTQNSGSTLISVEGPSGEARISNSNFTHNLLYDGLISVKQTSSAKLNNLHFSDNGCYALASDNSKILGDNLFFDGSELISANHSIISLSRSSLNASTEVTAIVAKNSVLSIVSSKFGGKCYGGLIKMDGFAKLEGIDFASSEEYSLPNELLKTCSNCKFMNRAVVSEVNTFDNIILALEIALFSFVSFRLKGKLMMIFRYIFIPKRAI